MFVQVWDIIDVWFSRYDQNIVLDNGKKQWQKRDIVSNGFFHLDRKGK